MSRRAVLAAASALGFLAPAVALAHTPYLLPNTFNPERDRVTIQGALTEDDYFNPDIALQAPSYVETLPSGQLAELKPAVTLKDVALIEAPLQASGTYRFSTGDFAGRKNTVVKVGDRWLNVRQARPPRPAGEGGPPGRPQGGPPGGGEGGEGPPNSIAEADIPAGAERIETAQVMTVETYISKGAPTEAATRTTGKGFELKPMQHPNQLYVDQGFAFQLLVDGKPVEGAPISIYRSGNIYDDKRIAIETKSDAKGMAKASFTQPGVYMLTTRYPAAQRKPGEAPVPKSYTYSLTFEVTR